MSSHPLNEEVRQLLLDTIKESCNKIRKDIDNDDGYGGHTSVYANAEAICRLSEAYMVLQGASD